MPANLVSTLVGLCVSFAVAVIVFLGLGFGWVDITLGNIADDAAHVAALTQSAQDVQNQINLDLTQSGLPTSWNGVTLFTVTQLSAVSPGQTGFYTNVGPTTPNATVTIQYNLPLPFDRALTLIGGPVLDATVPITKTGTDFNQTQYTGVGP